MKLAASLFSSHLAAALTDQAVVSFGNFVLSIWLARRLAVNDYGVYALALSFIVFLNTLHQALITYPLSVRGAPADKARYRQLLHSAGVHTPFFALAALPVLIGAVASVGRLDLLALVFAVLLAGQWQEVNRRGALARADFRAAIVSDAVRYLGALGVVVALGSLATLERTFMIVLMASLIAALPMFYTIARTHRALRFQPELAANWKLGAPVFGANLLAAFSTQWFLWLLAWRSGPTGSASLVALTNIAAVASPVMFGAENILVPEIARMRDSLTYAELKYLLRRRGLICGVLVAPLFGLVFLFPETALRLIYGAASPYTAFADALRLLTLAYSSYLASYILGAALRGYGSSEPIFKMQLYPALLGVTAGSLLTWQFGIAGACTACLLAGVLRAGTALYYVLKLRDLAVPAAGAP